MLHPNTIVQITKAVVKHYASNPIDHMPNAIVPQQLDFGQSSRWLGAAYQGILNTTLGSASGIVLPIFVLCYSPCELVMLLVAETVTLPSGCHDYYVYEFTWGERDCVYGGRTFLLTV